MSTDHPEIRIDWQALAARHDAAPHDDDEAWLEAMECFDHDPSVRAEALEADPLLLFRQLPEATVDDGEVEAMREAVAGLRRAASLGVLEAADPPPARRMPWRAAAAVASTALAAALLLPAPPTSDEAAAPQLADAPTVAEPGARETTPRLYAAPRATARPAPGAALATFESLPLVEESEAHSWIQINDAALSIVVVDLDSTPDFDV
ncbi:MAG: hypothetical protein AAGC60_28940 [Acidobacteriota bacterium]